MFTLKIKDTKKGIVQHTQEHFLDVEVEILDENGKAVSVRKYAYPLDATEEFIRSDLDKALRLYIDEHRNAEKEQADNALHTQADATAEALKGNTLEINQIVAEE